MKRISQHRVGIELFLILKLVKARMKESLIQKAELVTKLK